MDEEYTERMFAKMEQQINTSENNLKGLNLTKQERSWFQTMKQRKEEKERLSITTTDDNKIKKRNGSGIGGDSSGDRPNKKRKIETDKKRNSKGNKKSKKDDRAKRPEQLAKERALKELEKVSLVRAKLAKLRNRQGRLGAVPEEKPENSWMPKKKSSKFSNDLTDVSQKGAKRLR